MQACKLLNPPPSTIPFRHPKYYDTKMKMMKQGTAGSISINNDFGGEVL